MLRNLTIVALSCLFLGSMVASSEAGAAGRSFKVEASDGTDAGIAFEGGLFPNDVLVHTPDGDFHGNFLEIPLIIGGNSIVFASANDNGYVGGFVAIVTDAQILVPGTATIRGVLVGSTGIFSFEGGAKN